MRIGVPAETYEGERRVATTPDAVEQLRKLGFTVAVQSGAGAAASFTDDAYREAGDVSKPTVLLLHGVPSSSRMYDGLLRKLGDRYHLVAPDYPGFGNSDAPDPAKFAYTFDNLATVMHKFTDAVGAQCYVLLMQDYGAPVGMRWRWQC